MKKILTALILLISSFAISAQPFAPVKNPVESNSGNLSGASAKDQSSNPQVLIYPNPAISFVKVSLNSPGSERARVLLLDNIGNKVGENSYELEEGQNTLTLSLGELELKPGIYFLQIHLPASTITRKLVIRE